MIVCAGLTPAWQHILEFEQVELGQVNRAKRARWCASGKPINAAIAVRFLGGPVRLVCVAGGYRRLQIEEELFQLDVPMRCVVSDAVTRVCTTLIDRSKNQITELVEEAAPLTQEELEQFVSVFDQEASQAKAVVLTGSLPPGTPADFYCRLIRGCNCPIIADFRGQPLLEALPLRPLVVKPNRQELAQTFGTKLNSDRKLLEAMRELNRLGAEWVVVTDGDKAVWVTSCEEAYRLQPLRVKPVVNTIGCGDAMAGAIAWAVTKREPMLEAVRLGIAAAADNARQLLPCRLDRSWVMEQAKRVRVEKVH